MKKSWIAIILFFFVLTAFSGFLMRTEVLFPLNGITYEYVLHAHSHIAILGWCFNLLVLIFFFQMILSFNEKKRFRFLFWIYQGTMIFMFIAFFLQGYGLYSIIFSTIQILLSYIYSIIIWKAANRFVHQLSITPITFSMIKLSIICLILSSFGPWTLAVLSANGLQESPYYEASIYFYLHFQYNGWLTIGLLAAVINLIQSLQINVEEKYVRMVYYLLLISIIPSYFISIIWMDESIWLNIIGFIGSFLHWMAVIIFCLIVFKNNQIKNALNRWSYLFFVLSFILLIVKASIEIGPSIPYLSNIVFENRSLVIGYIHLSLLGFISFLMISFIIQYGWIQLNRSVKSGLILFIIGFSLNELMLFSQGLIDWIRNVPFMYTHQILWIAALLLFIGIMFIFVGAIKKGRKKLLMLMRPFF